MKNTELSNMFTNVNETGNKNSSEEETTINEKQILIEREEVENTPFMKINNIETNKSMLVLGNYRITEEMELGTEEEYEKMKAIQGIDWNMMISIIGIITEQQVKIIELQKQQN